MKQTIYCVVEHYFINGVSQHAYIISAHTHKCQAEQAVKDDYKEMAFMRTTTFAELMEFGGVRGIVRSGKTSCSIYVAEREVEIEC